MFARVISRASRPASRVGRGMRSFQTASSSTNRRLAGAGFATAAGVLGYYGVQQLQPNMALAESGHGQAGGTPPPQCPAHKPVEPPTSLTNSAFIFIKPHAVTQATIDMVSANLKSRGITIVKEGDIKAEEIDAKMLVDQHYYAIASKATLLKPEQLNVPAGKFKQAFGVEWADVLAQGKAVNAKDACAKWGLDAAGLDKYWKKAKLTKFGGGFYCGLVEVPGKEPLYVFNGFFMSMRGEYVIPGRSIHYYVVEWDAKKLNWGDFRGKVLGPTDPKDAPADSLRGKIEADWQALGLKEKPNVGNNGVHASASPFEGLAERMNWLEAKVGDDAFGKQMLQAGISEDTIKEWSVDPQVLYGSKFVPIRKSLFDSLEDTDTDECLALSLMIARGPNALCAKQGNCKL